MALPLWAPTRSRCRALKTSLEPPEGSCLVRVFMPMMKVGVVRMLVPHRRVVVEMGMGLVGRVTAVVDMLVVLVMDVPMFVVEG